ncbi:MAG: enoyl-CoA hydratase/isomerase family protein [Thermodesulfobacteriota bacterium]|nr:enoyl-CoA hydratase/isomerase family protein [Thermodesulfobacteriota bacterium]
MEQREYTPAIEPGAQLKRDIEWVKKEILVEKDPDSMIAQVIFNRPEKLNSLMRSHYLYLAKVISELNWDNEVKVIIFKGAGRCFGTGHDVGELGTMHGHDTKGKAKRPSQKQRLLVDMGLREHIIEPIYRCVKTTISQVHNYCYGAHFQIAMASDLVLCTPDARFTHPGFRYIGPTLDLALWLQIMGVRRLKEMVLTGKPFTAEEALQYGLVNKVVSDDKLEEETNKMAQAAASLPFDGIVMGKTFLQGVLDAAGVAVGEYIGYMGHAMQTGIHYEPGEFNLLKERRDKGIKGSTITRDGIWPEGYDLR